MLRSKGKRMQVGRRLATVIEPDPLARYYQEVLRDTPVAFWPMQDTSGNPVDVSGNSRDMTSVTGTPDYQFEAGPFGRDYAIRLVGGEALNRSSVVSTATNDLTMEMWIKFYTFSAADQVVFHNGNAATNGWGIRAEGNTYKVLVGAIAELTAESASEDIWFHIVANRDSGDSSRWKYYANGAVANSNAGTTAPNTPSGTVLIGAASLQISIAYVAVYDSALSAARIAAHYNAAGIKATPYR